MGEVEELLANNEEVDDPCLQACVEHLKASYSVVYDALELCGTSEAAKDEDEVTQADREGAAVTDSERVTSQIQRTSVSFEKARKPVPHSLHS